MEDTAALESLIQAEITARRGILNLARKTSLGHAREIGRLLVELKDATGRGEFVPALTRCGLSERSAYRYIRLHEQSCHVAGITTTIRDAEAAVATPRPATQERDRERQAEPAVQIIPKCGLCAEDGEDVKAAGSVPEGWLCAKDLKLAEEDGAPVVRLDTRPDEEREPDGFMSHMLQIEEKRQARRGFKTVDEIMTLNAEDLVRQLGHLENMKGLLAKARPETLRLCVEVGERAKKLLAALEPEPPAPKGGGKKTKVTEPEPKACKHPKCPPKHCLRPSITLYRMAGDKLETMQVTNFTMKRFNEGWRIEKDQARNPGAYLEPKPDGEPRTITVMSERTPATPRTITVEVTKGVPRRGAPDPA